MTTILAHTGPVAHDPALAARIRDLLPSGVEVTERVMFGGLAFLLGGHLAIAASGQGGVMVRCDPGDTDALVAEPGVARMVMRGREVDGWLRVGADQLDTDAELRRWVDTGTAYAGSLPPR